MSACLLFAQPFAYIVDVNGLPLVGAQITVFLTGTVTPQPVYTDSDLSVAWTQPIVTNAAGQSSGPIYCTPTPSLNVVVVDANSVPVSGFPIDPWTPYALGELMHFNGEVTLGSLIQTCMIVLALIRVYIGLAARLDRLETRMDPLWSWFTDSVRSGRRDADRPRVLHRDS